MSTRDQKTGLVQPRAGEVFDEDIDLLQALQFAHEEDEQSATPTTSVVNADGDSPESTDPETKVHPREGAVAIERRLATLREFKKLATLGDVDPIEPPIIGTAPPEAERGRARDSLITVPPATTTVQPPSLFPLPVLRVPLATPIRTVPLARRFTPAFAAALTARPLGSMGRLTWGVVIATVGIALPGGLLLGRALTSRADAMATAGSTTWASTAAASDNHPLAAALASASPTPSASATVNATASSSAQVVSYSADWSTPVRAPRAVHHGKGKLAPKPAASAASADIPAKAAASAPSADAPAPVDSSGATIP